MEVAASAEAVALVEVVAFAGAASVRTGFPVRVAVSAISMLVTLQSLAVRPLHRLSPLPLFRQASIFVLWILPPLFLPERVGFLNLTVSTATMMSTSRPSRLLVVTYIARIHVNIKRNANIHATVIHIAIVLAC